MPRVSLFVTCIVDQLFPQVGMAMAKVLERLGYEVDFPEAQTCCGQPAFNSGYPEEARKVARHFLKVFGDAEHIVVPSGSCTSMITHHYEDIFENDPKIREDADAWLRTFGNSRVFYSRWPRWKTWGHASMGSSRITIAAMHCARCASKTARGDCWPKCEDWSCAKWMPPRNAADSAVRSP